MWFYTGTFVKANMGTETEVKSSASGQNNNKSWNRVDFFTIVKTEKNTNKSHMWPRKLKVPHGALSLRVLDDRLQFCDTQKCR